MNDMDSIINSMLKNIDPTINITPVKSESQPAQRQFYAHINKGKLQIVAISPVELSGASNEEVISIKIDFSVAEKFLTGAENPVRWVAAYKDGEYSIQRASDIKEKTPRVEVMPIYEVTQEKLPYPDIWIEVDRKRGNVLINYNGATIQNWPSPAKLYLTREGDPSYLKCAFALDVNTLYKITEQNELSEWPNPIVLPLEEVDDLSVYAMKSNLKIMLGSYETIHHGI